VVDRYVIMADPWTVMFLLSERPACLETKHFSTLLPPQDPHYVGGAVTREELHAQGWVSWQSLDTFTNHTFYNLCMPQITARGPTDIG